MTTLSMNVEAGCGSIRGPDFIATIPGMLQALADRYGDREAQVFGSKRITYRELEQRSARLAQGMLALGLGKGSHVGILMPNSPDFTLAFMAATRIGAVAVPLSTLYQAPELRWVVDHADIQTLLVVDGYRRHDYLARLEEAFPSLAGQTAGELFLREAPRLRSVMVWGGGERGWASHGPTTLEHAAQSRPIIDGGLLAAVEAAVVPADPLCIIYTSGSTASPKGVLHGHGPFIRHSYQMAHEFWPLGDGDRIVSVRAFFWIAGLSATLFYSLIRGCCLITPDDASGVTLRGLIEHEGATAVAGDETWLCTLRDDRGLRDAGYEIVRLSMAAAGIAVRSAAGLRFLKPGRAAGASSPIHMPDDLFPRSFGMTETCGTHSAGRTGEMLPPDRPRRNGRPVPGVAVKIVDPETRQPLGAGEYGELLVSGYCMMQGLYKREREETFTPDGFYATGDLCCLDEHGYLVFASRLGEMIKVRGANVAPLEVEMTLNTLAGIERSALVGLPAVDGGIVLVAAVVLTTAAPFVEADIRTELSRRLSSYKVPERVFSIAAQDLPTTGSGKIRKSALAELLQTRWQVETVQ